MIIRRIIGLILIIISVASLVSSHSSKKKIDELYESARHEILFSTSQIGLNESGEFQSDYLYSHGTLVRNAELIEEEQNADIVIQTQSGKPEYLRYRSENEFVVISCDKNPVTVMKKNHFDGEVQFLNSVCGCEKLPFVIVNYASIIASCFLIPMGLYLALIK